MNEAKLKRRTINTKSKKEDNTKNRELMLQMIDGLEDMDEDDDMIYDNDFEEGFKIKIKRYLKYLSVKFMPLEEDINWCTINYGSGVSTFMVFYRFTVLNTIPYAIVWAYPLIYHTVVYDGDWTDHTNTPKWLLFSGFASEHPLPLLYTLSLIFSSFVLICFVFLKLSREFKMSVQNVIT
eukprot:UN31669